MNAYEQRHKNAYLEGSLRNIDVNFYNSYSKCNFLHSNKNKIWTEERTWSYSSSTKKCRWDVTSVGKYMDLRFFSRAHVFKQHQLGQWTCNPSPERVKTGRPSLPGESWTGVRSSLKRCWRIPKGQRPTLSSGLCKHVHRSAPVHLSTSAQVHIQRNTTERVCI